ncbi:MAG: site-specific DNA-methyltransferase [Candidatus Thermoplasmatota archaeon]|jgi:site-specific DNA-methyltransferase (adenine-specific)/modification methylase|nr:site-specific DNA-methyltransferase [Candidatus Thermoplasmatota archaeon]
MVKLNYKRALRLNINMEGYYSPDKFLNSIINSDTVEGLKKIPSESMDLVFADPPYNLQLQNDLMRPNQTKVNAVRDDWDRFSSFSDYDNFSTAWLKECKRVMKKDAVIWVIGTYHNIFRIGKIMQDLGFWILNDIIWIKTNPMPNFRGTRFTNAHETLIFASRDKDSKYTFHYKSMKIFNEDLQMRSDWLIPICAGSERIKADGKKVHSTQKPEELLKRILLSSSNPGDSILDPFMGSGTTGAMSKLLGRNFTGIESSEEYVKIARERIDKIKPLEKELLLNPAESKIPRVPFGTLVLSGIIREGEKLYSQDGKTVAIVLANGTIKSGKIIGSIHSVGSTVPDGRHNGWKFWYVLREGKFVSIDLLREGYFSNLLQE